MDINQSEQEHINELALMLASDEPLPRQEPLPLPELSLEDLEELMGEAEQEPASPVMPQEEDEQELILDHRNPKLGGWNTEYNVQYKSGITAWMKCKLVDKPLRVIYQKKLKKEQNIRAQRKLTAKRFGGKLALEGTKPE